MVVFNSYVSNYQSLSPKIVVRVFSSQVSGHILPQFWLGKDVSIEIDSWKGGFYHDKWTWTD